MDFQLPGPRRGRESEADLRCGRQKRGLLPAAPGRHAPALFRGQGPVASDIFEFTDRLTKGDYRAVQWSAKWALIAHTLPAEAPAKSAARKKAAEKAPLTIQDRLVPGLVLELLTRRRALVQGQEPGLSECARGRPEQPAPVALSRPNRAVDAKLNELGILDYIEKPWGHVKAGETFTVLKKLTAGYAGDVDVPTLFRGERFTLPLSSLEPVIGLAEAA